MGTYLVLYTGGSGMGETPEKQQEIMAAWGAWYEKMGPAIADGGAPFGEAKHLTADGVGDGPLSQPAPTGYTVFQADSLDAAVDACRDHPHLRYGGALQVFTCIDMSAAG